MSTPAMLCGVLEIALNRYLRLEPAVIAECASLDGRTLQFVLSGVGLSFCVEFMPAGIRVLPEPPQAPDVRVEGSVGAMLSVLRQALRENGGLPSGLQVEGDTELLSCFRGMLARVGFDPEEWLTPLLGGAVAHRVVGGLRDLFSWSRDTTRRVADHGAEYLREETYDLARGRDVEMWMDEVDHSRDTLDRLEARLGRLEAATRSKTDLA